MKIGILGTRGIPNHYGGFEQFAMELSKYLIRQGHEVFVYSTSDHPYQESNWEGVQLIHQYNPEKTFGLFAQFLYDLKCILDTRKRKFDVLLQLGYTTNAIWSFLLPKKQSVIVTNMDGLEWKRSKYPAIIQSFLKKSECWAVRSSHYLIADSIGIQSYLKDKYAVEAAYIAYGTDVITENRPNLISPLQLLPDNYCLLIARMQTDNNVETIIKGYLASNMTMPLIIVGNYEHNKTGKAWYSKYNSHHIRFVGGIYQRDVLDQLRRHCYFYFHGHSCGGTNPSLLEAMACGTHIIAHNNIFNSSILQTHAYYFENENEITAVLNVEKPQLNVKQQCMEIILENFTLDIIHQQTENYLLACWSTLSPSLRNKKMT
jgi:glycosyltransferase involved in cell wall biosynthesis